MQAIFDAFITLMDRAGRTAHPSRRHVYVAIRGAAKIMQLRGMTTADLYDWILESAKKLEGEGEAWEACERARKLLFDMTAL